MIQEWRTVKRLEMFFLFLGLMSLGTLLTTSAWGQTYVSGKVITADGMAVASGAVALEKGELHNNAFLVGGAIGPDGGFKIPLPAGGRWGLLAGPSPPEPEADHDGQKTEATQGDIAGFQTPRRRWHRRWSCSWRESLA